MPAVRFVGRLALAAWKLLRAAIIAATALATPAIAVAVALVLLVFFLLPGTVPQPRPVTEARPSVVLAYDGTLLAVLEDFTLSLPTDPDSIPDVVVDAVVSSEDRRFFDHDGVDLVGVARAVRANLDGDRQGGSTITQQLVKLRYLTDAPTADRKIREAIVAQQLEQQMSKDEIFHAYVSSAYFGSGTTGITAAAQRYFRKPVADLDVSEAAMLAGMLPAPSLFSPHVDLAAAEQARLRAVTSMEQTGALDPQEAADVAARPLVLVDPDGNPPEGTEGPFTPVWPLPESIMGPFPFITAYVEEYLVGRYGPDALARGLEVTVTIDPELQRLATGVATDATATTADPTVAASVVAVETRTGFVRAAASSVPWEQSRVNLAFGGSTGFPVGSVAKAFALTAALEAGSSPDTRVSAPREVVTPEGSVVRNFGGAAAGTMSLRQATVESWNTPFATLALDLGPGEVAAAGRRAGVTSWSQDKEFGPSVALGAYETSPVQMAAAFATFANRGRALPPLLVLRVVDGDGRVLEDNSVRNATPVIDPVVAANVTDVLADVITDGTGKLADIGRPAAGKTGTAENFSAAWFVGYTPQMSTAVWVGHTDGLRPLPPMGGVSQVTGGSVPARAWASFMRDATAAMPPESFATALPMRFAGPRPDLAADAPPLPPPPVDPVVRGLGGPQMTPTPTP